MNKKQLIFGKEFIIHKPNIHLIDHINTNVIVECSFEILHSLNNQFHIYDLNFRIFKNNKTENIILENVRSGRLPLLMRIQKTIINCQKKNKFNEINKLTIKVQGIISDLNLCYYLKLPLPMSAKERTLYEKLA